MMFTNGRLLKYLTVDIVLFINFTFGTEILQDQGTHPRFSKSTSPESVNIKCDLEGCSLSDVISVLENQHVSFVCNLTTSDQHNENHALQLILVDVNREFVLGDDSCRWQRRHDEEYLYCDLHVPQTFDNIGEKHLAYLVSPLEYFGNFTVIVVEASTNQASECKAPEEQSSTIQTVTYRRTQPLVQLYSGDEVPESGPSLVGKLIVGGIGFVLIITGLIILKRYCQENRREEVSKPQEQATHMIVYKTQPTWCQDPETDSEMDEMEPFLSHDSDE